MGEKFREGDGSYRRHLQEEAENEFLERAVKSISEGYQFDGFLKKNPSYTIANTSKWHLLYSQMQDRYKNSKIGTWTLETELQLARNRRIQEQLAAADRRGYEENKADLLSMAADHASWKETKRRLGMTDDMEKYFRQAQQEVGVFRSSERPDPYDQAFADGFFG